MEYLCNHQLMEMKAMIIVLAKYMESFGQVSLTCLATEWRKFRSSLSMLLIWEAFRMSIRVHFWALSACLHCDKLRCYCPAQWIVLLAIRKNVHILMKRIRGETLTLAQMRRGWRHLRLHGEVSNHVMFLVQINGLCVRLIKNIPFTSVCTRYTKFGDLSPLCVIITIA